MLRKLSHLQIEDIRREMQAHPSAATVARLAEAYGVSRDRIYAVTRDLRPARRPRADKGKRKAALTDHPVLRHAAGLVVAKHLSPELALEAAALHHGGAAPVTLTTFRRYLREHHLDAAARGVTLHVRTEASEPLEVVEADWTALKERWIDTDTRRILRLPQSDERNHPVTDARYERVWLFSAKDKYSRRWYLRCVVGRVPTQSDTLRCLLELFGLWGVPRTLYTDNGSELAGPTMRVVARVLDEALRDAGGFRLLQHAPRNARATGAVEQSNRTADKFLRLLGLLPARELTLEALNTFCDRVVGRYNATPNRATGVPPELRFRSGLTTVRTLPPTVTAALLDVRVYRDVALRPDLTIRVERRTWALPRVEPFLTAAMRRQKATVYFPRLDSQDEVGWMIVEREGENGWQARISRVEHRPHAHGEFRALPATAAQQLTRTLSAGVNHAHPVVPLYHVPDAERRVAVLPPRRVETPAAALGVFAPSDDASPEIRPKLEPAQVVCPPPDDAPTLTLLDAKRWLLDHGAPAPLDDDVTAWLRAVFAGRRELPQNELAQAWEARRRPRRLAAV